MQEPPHAQLWDGDWSYGEQYYAFFKGFLWLFFKSFRVTWQEGHLWTEVEFQAGVFVARAAGWGQKS